MYTTALAILVTATINTTPAKTEITIALLIGLIGYPAKESPTMEREEQSKKNKNIIYSILLYTCKNPTPTADMHFVML